MRWSHSVDWTHPRASTHRHSRRHRAYARPLQTARLESSGAQLQEMPPQSTQPWLLAVVVVISALHLILVSRADYTDHFWSTTHDLHVGTITILRRFLD